MIFHFPLDFFRRGAKIMLCEIQVQLIWPQAFLSGSCRYRLYCVSQTRPVCARALAGQFFFSQKEIELPKSSKEPECVASQSDGHGVEVPD